MVADPTDPDGEMEVDLGMSVKGPPYHIKEVPPHGISDLGRDSGIKKDELEPSVASLPSGKGLPSLPRARSSIALRPEEGASSDSG